MTLKQTLVLAVPLVGLCALGAFASRVSVDVAERARSDSIAELLASALDEPSKLTPDHVRTVIGSVRTLEEVGRRGEAALAASIAGIARGCFLLAAMSAVSIAVIVWQQSARRAETSGGLRRPPQATA